MPTDSSRRGRIGILAVASGVGALIALAPPSARAQVPSSNLGLPAVGALGIHGGFARLERSSDGFEAGALLDLGWLRGRSLRLQGEVTILQAKLTEFVEDEDSTYEGNYIDVSAGVSAVWLANPDSRLTPYVLAGAAVHALSSTFGTLVLDRRYNTNRFGSHLGAGIRLRLSGGTALFVEARRVITDEADRTVVRLGGLMLLGDLAHHR